MPDSRYANEFREFYLAFPRKINSTAAYKVFVELADEGVDPLHLIERARAFAGNVDPDRLEYVPYPATWLRDRRFEDSDLLTDQRQAERAWLQQKWREADAKSVADKYGLIYNHPPIPDDIDKKGLDQWAKDQRRIWITKVAAYALDNQPPPE